MPEEAKWVGAYGCAGMLVRVEWTAATPWRRQSLGNASAHKQAHSPHTRRPKTAWDIKKCPACGRPHRVNVTWRVLGERATDDEFKSDVQLPKAEAA